MILRLVFPQNNMHCLSSVCISTSSKCSGALLMLFEIIQCVLTLNFSATPPCLCKTQPLIK